MKNYVKSAKFIRAPSEGFALELNKTKSLLQMRKEVRLSLFNVMLMFLLPSLRRDLKFT